MRRLRQTTLTEQWEKHELPEGMYYIKYGGVDKIDYWFGNYWEDGWNDTVEEVLAPVPSYVEWQQLHKFLEEFNALEVAKENKKLKELLKECRVYVENCEQFNAYDFEMLKTIDNAIGEK